MPHLNPCWPRSICLMKWMDARLPVLGDMLELGPYEKQGHEIGRDARRTGCKDPAYAWSARAHDC